MQGQSQSHDCPENALQNADFCHCPWKGCQGCQDMPRFLCRVLWCCPQNSADAQRHLKAPPHARLTIGPALAEVMGCCRCASWPFRGLSPTARWTSGWHLPTLAEHHPGPDLCQGKCCLQQDCTSSSQGPVTAAVHPASTARYLRGRVTERSYEISPWNLVLPLACVIIFMRNTTSLENYEKPVSIFDPYI